MAKTKGLYKRGNIWWIRYTGPDGKKRFESSMSSSQRDAEALLITRKKDVMQGKDPLARIIHQPEKSTKASTCDVRVAPSPAASQAHHEPKSSP